jgi:hypothetical protein
MGRVFIFGVFIFFNQQRYTMSQIINRTLLILLTALIIPTGCDNGDSLEARFDGLAPVAELDGVDTGKFDQAHTVATWSLREDGEYSMLEGLNQLGERSFAAVIPVAPEGEQMTVHISGESRCELLVETASLALISTSCSEADLKALEIPTIQLVSTLTPSLEMGGEMKGDGLLTKIACVGAGIGAALISAIVWQFASSVAIAGASVSTTVPILSAGGTVLGAVSLCYSAFFDGGEVSSCVGGCDDDLSCVEGCVLIAKSEHSALSGADLAERAATDLMQCVSECDGLHGCEPICYELVSSRMEEMSVE